MRRFKFFPHRSAPVLVASTAALAVISCGGGGGGGTAPSTTTSTTSTTSGSTSGTTGVSDVPTAKTKSDVAANLAAYGQGVISNDFKAYGPEDSTLDTVEYEPSLGLYWILGITGDHTIKNYFLDQAETKPAGSLQYNLTDVMFTTAGPISITGGRVAGLTGYYSQTLQFNQTSGTTGYTGTVSYTTPGLGTTDNEFSIQFDSAGDITGTATNAVSLQNGYLQTEKISFLANGTSTSTSTDTSSCATAFTFAADLSGSGQITGTDPGLPAAVTWDNTGTGKVTFKNGTVTSFSLWQFPTT